MPASFSQPRKHCQRNSDPNVGFWEAIRTTISKLSNSPHLQNYNHHLPITHRPAESSAAAGYWHFGKINFRRHNEFVAIIWTCKSKGSLWKNHGPPLTRGQPVHVLRGRARCAEQSCTELHGKRARDAALGSAVPRLWCIAGMTLMKHQHHLLTICTTVHPGVHQRDL